MYIREDRLWVGVHFFRTINGRSLGMRSDTPLIVPLSLLRIRYLQHGCVYKT